MNPNMKQPTQQYNITPKRWWNKTNSDFVFHIIKPLLIFFESGTLQSLATHVA